ncbi:hypothetical protein [Salipiger sp. PrR002]|uniref:hypothetical protein n=1 Tax=Salipiger sp. PrR002 TaxID=2706489 RepID=UPI0013B73DE5|nr:hypothetical protein [Salipiger sp. PrR002]NDW02473.1 hypothetical protein [Salipiger sp. PrR002]NDW59656.1 hypothetical protein [Salipiger sp. PrR004]
MKHLLGAAATAALAFTGSLAVTSQPARAYQIDCAILLCLSGGWPASAPCVAAKTEFIRRITPSPIEPPLQIWRCPMHAAYPGNARQTPEQRLYDVAFDRGAHPVQFPFGGDIGPAAAFKSAVPPVALISAVLKEAAGSGAPRPALLQQIADYTSENGVADIDISDPVFDFVRSIRVYSVEVLRQRERGSDNDHCERRSRVRVGRYGLQGDFYWRDSSPSALPVAFVGDEGWGESCPYISRRSVFVDWSDYHGNYGYEQVNY